MSPGLYIASAIGPTLQQHVATGGECRGCTLIRIQSRPGKRRYGAALLAKAAKGDVPAINALADRTDGKVAQALIGDASEDAVQVHTIVRKIVEPDAK